MRSADTQEHNNSEAESVQEEEEVSTTEASPT